jgi:hypothetical protein
MKGSRVEEGEGQDRTGQDRTGQDRTGQDRTGQDRTGQDRTGQRGYERCRTLGMSSMKVFILGQWTLIKWWDGMGCDGGMKRGKKEEGSVAVECRG